MRGGIVYKKKETIFYIVVIVLYLFVLTYVAMDSMPKAPW